MHRQAIRRLAGAVLAAAGVAPAPALAQEPTINACPAVLPRGVSDVSCWPERLPDGREAQLCRKGFSHDSPPWCWVLPGASMPVPAPTEPALFEPGMPNLNVGIGQAFEIDNAPRKDGFSWHILPSLGLHFGSAKTFGLKPELGYAQEMLGDEKARLFVAGVGPFWSPFKEPALEVRYAPRFVVGKAGETAVGVRHGVALQAFFGLVGVEFSHQALWIGDSVQHDGRALFTFDPALALFGLVAGGAIAIWGPPGGGRPLVAAGRSILAPLRRGGSWA